MWAVVGDLAAQLPASDTTLLSQMSRTLSLRELSQQFTKNPAFPFVANVQDIREAIFQMLSGVERYEVVDSGGQVYTISSSNDLTLGSNDQFLRRFVEPPKPAHTTTSQFGEPAPGGNSVADAHAKGTSGHSRGGEDTPTGGPPTETKYKRYTVRVPNRSVVSEPNRDAIWGLLAALADAADPTGPDLQLIDIDVTITAAEGSLGSVQSRAESANAKWDEEEDLLS